MTPARPRGGSAGPAQKPARVASAGSGRGPSGAGAGVEPAGRELWTATWPLPAVLATCAGLILLGFVVGVGGAFAHPTDLTLGVSIPVGLPIAIGAMAGVLISAGVLTRSRLGAGMPLLGWVISVLLFTSARPEGDIVIAATGEGYAYLFGGVLVLSVLMALPFGGRRR